MLSAILNITVRSAIRTISYLDIGSPPGSKLLPLPEPLLTKICDAIWRHYVVISKLYATHNPPWGPFY